MQPRCRQLGQPHVNTKRRWAVPVMQLYEVHRLAMLHAATRLQQPLEPPWPFSELPLRFLRVLPRKIKITYQ